MPDIQDKPIELFSLGKSGYLVAIGQLPEEEEKKSPPKPHDISFSVEETNVKDLKEVSQVKSKSFLDDHSLSIHTAKQNTSQVLKEQLEANEAKDKEILELRKRLEVVDSNFKALSQANEELEREKAVSQKEAMDLKSQLEETQRTHLKIKSEFAQSKEDDRRVIEELKVKITETENESSSLKQRITEV